MIWGNLCTGVTQCYYLTVTDNGPHYAAPVIAGSNPAEGLDVCLLFSVHCGSSILCDTLITYSEEPYQVCESNCA